SLPLLLGDRLDAAAPDITEEGRRIDGVRDGYGRPRVEPPAEQAQAVINEKELHQQRRALEQLDVARRRESDGREARDPQDRDENAEQAAEREGKQRQDDGPAGRREDEKKIVGGEEAHLSLASAHEHDPVDGREKSPEGNRDGEVHDGRDD